MRSHTQLAICIYTRGTRANQRKRASAAALNKSETLARRTPAADTFYSSHAPTWNEHEARFELVECLCSCLCCCCWPCARAVEGAADARYGNRGAARALLCRTNNYARFYSSALLIPKENNILTTTQEHIIGARKHTHARTVFPLLLSNI